MAKSTDFQPVNHYIFETIEIGT